MLLIIHYHERKAEVLSIFSINDLAGIQIHHWLQVSKSTRTYFGSPNPELWELLRELVLRFSRIWILETLLLAFMLYNDIQVSKVVPPKNRQTFLDKSEVYSREFIKYLSMNNKYTPCSSGLSYIINNGPAFLLPFCLFSKICNPTVPCARVHRLVFQSELCELGWRK